MASDKICQTTEKMKEVIMDCIKSYKKTKKTPRDPTPIPGARSRYPVAASAGGADPSVPGQGHRPSLPEIRPEVQLIPIKSPPLPPPPPPTPPLPPPPPPCACDHEKSMTSSSGSRSSKDKEYDDLFYRRPDICISLPVCIGNMRDLIAGLHETMTEEEQMKLHYLEEIQRQEAELFNGNERKGYRRCPACVKDKTEDNVLPGQPRPQDAHMDSEEEGVGMDDMKTPFICNTRKDDSLEWHLRPLFAVENGPKEGEEPQKDPVMNAHLLADTFILHLGRQLTLFCTPQRELYDEAGDRVELESLSNEILRNFSDSYVIARNGILNRLKYNANVELDKWLEMQAATSNTALIKYLIYQILECRGILMMEKVVIRALVGLCDYNQPERFNPRIANQFVRGKGSRATVSWLFRCLAQLKEKDIGAYQFMVTLISNFHVKNGTILQCLRKSLDAVERFDIDLVACDDQRVQSRNSDDWGSTCGAYGGSDRGDPVSSEELDSSEDDELLMDPNIFAMMKDNRFPNIRVAADRPMVGKGVLFDPVRSEIMKEKKFNELMARMPEMRAALQEAEGVVKRAAAAASRSHELAKEHEKRFNAKAAILFISTLSLLTITPKEETKLLEIVKSGFEGAACLYRKVLEARKIVDEMEKLSLESEEAQKKGKTKPNSRSNKKATKKQTKSSKAEAANAKTIQQNHAVERVKFEKLVTAFALMKDQVIMESVD